MERIKRKAKIPLSLFYLKYFAYIFAFLCLLAISLLILFNALMNHKVVYPADYAQKKAHGAYHEIQMAEKVTADRIPELCDYAIFDSEGNVKSGNLRGNAAQKAWDAVREKRQQSGNTVIQSFREKRNIAFYDIRFLHSIDPLFYGKSLYRLKCLFCCLQFSGCFLSSS